MLAKLRSLLARYCGSHPVKIILTESNSVSYNPGKETTSIVNGLFAVEDVLSWLQNGGSNATWWDLHNGAELNNTRLNGKLYGTTPYGDYGLLSNGSQVTDTSAPSHVTYSEPPPNTPFPPYIGLKVLGPALAAGSTFVRATSAMADVNAYATRQPDKRLTLVLVNTSSTKSYTITPTFRGFTPASGTVDSFAATQPADRTSALSVHNGAFSYALSPYSVAVFHLTPA